MLHIVLHNNVSQFVPRSGVLCNTQISQELLNMVPIRYTLEGRLQLNVHEIQPTVCNGILTKKRIKSSR